MKASELIKKLEEQIELVGDRDCICGETNESIYVKVNSVYVPGWRTEILISGVVKF